MSSHCFAQYFQGIPTTRVKTLEAGSTNILLIEPDASKTDPLGLQLTEHGAPIGALRFACRGFATANNQKAGEKENPKPRPGYEGKSSVFVGSICQGQAHPDCFAILDSAHFAAS